MNKTLAILFSLFAFAASPAHAFLSAQDEIQILKTLNEENLNPGVHFEDIRCSLRNRTCLVKMEIQEHRKTGCMIERMTDSGDLYTEQKDQKGHSRMVLSPYAEETLAACLAAQL
ncbi:hypothetical protein [Bdellovibrio sp.]|uniref:hypothetical protein n=1 Tax=Bdellovibrio TaxID=958 RepID=UPI003221E896